MVKLSGYIKFERHIIGGKTTRELSEEQGVCIGTIFKEFYRIEDAIRASLNHRKNKKCNTLS